MHLLIPGLPITTTLGVFEWEQTPRVFTVDLEVEYDGARAAQSDDIKDTLDYAEVERMVVEDVARRKFQLIEKLIAHIAALILAMPRVAAVTVTAHKPGALQHAKDVAIRERFVR